MKIFWTSAVGRNEHGHSVIFLGRTVDHGVEMVRFWSSNQPFGFGQKSVPRARIKYAIFSRLETPENIVHALELPARNPYLGDLVHRESSLPEALAKAGVVNAPVRVEATRDAQELEKPFAQAAEIPHS